MNVTFTVWCHYIVSLYTCNLMNGHRETQANGTGRSRNCKKWNVGKFDFIQIASTSIILVHNSLYIYWWAVGVARASCCLWPSLSPQPSTRKHRCVVAIALMFGTKAKHEWNVRCAPSRVSVIPCRHSFESPLHQNSVSNPYSSTFLHLYGIKLTVAMLTWSVITILATVNN